MENGKKTVLYFFKNPDACLKFWELVMQEGLETEVERHQLLKAMAEEGHIETVIETGRSKSKVIEDYKKHYKTIDLTGIKPEGDDIK